jgi:AraC family L-rhamnose operon transcriptional activator RhaR
LIPESSELYRLLYDDQHSKISSYRDHNDQFLNLFKSAYLEYYQQEISYRAMVKTYLLQILLQIHRTQTNKQLLDSNQPIIDNQKIKDAIQYIHINYDEKLSLKVLSDLTFMSTSHFQEQFKQATGQTFKRYLQLVRIQKSCELLKTTGQTVQQIAQTVGYSDMKFYHALFLKITGMTPKLYRRHHLSRYDQ